MLDWKEREREVGVGEEQARRSQSSHHISVVTHPIFRKPHLGAVLNGHK